MVQNGKDPFPFCTFNMSRMTRKQADWLKYLALLAALCALVLAAPVLWEIGVVGALGGAVWIFAWPRPDQAADE